MRRLGAIRRGHAARPAAVGVVGIVCFSAGAASAHHSSSAYDLSRTTTLAGEVVAYEWSNPHVMLTVRDATGRVWEIETDAPATMEQTGWSRDSYAAGDAVTARINPARNAATAAGLLISVRGADWISRGSVARTGAPTRTSAMLISALALLIFGALLAGRRMHGASGAIVVSGVGAGLLLWTLQFSFSMPAQLAGIALLLAGAAWAARASVQASRRLRGSAGVVSPSTGAAQR